MLHDRHAADDAFQATFIILARKANSLRQPAALGPWLYGVATRTALKLRGRDIRRRLAERQAAVGTSTEPLDALVWRDLQPVLDEAIASLPEHFRVPFVLHHLEGGRQQSPGGRPAWLNCPQGTIAARLARAKERLRGRLAHKGLAASVGGLLALLSKNVASAGVPGTLLGSTARAATVAAGQEMALEAGPAAVAALAQGGIKAMIVTKVKLAAAVLLLAGVAGGGVGLFGQPTAGEVQTGAKQGGGLKPAAGQGQRPRRRTRAAQTRTKTIAFQNAHSTADPAGWPAAAGLSSGSRHHPASRLPPVKRGIPSIYQESRDDYDIVVECLVDRLDPPRFFPMVGPAQLRHLHYKCTVHFTEIIECSFPFPFQSRRRRSEVVFMDRDQLYLFNVAAEKAIGMQQAEKDFQVAEFYRRTGHPGSARFYYELVCRRYPGTTFAEKAAKHLLEAASDRPRTLAVVNGQAILDEEVFAAAYLTSADAHPLPGVALPWQLTANRKETLDRLVEREVVLQKALGTFGDKNPMILAKLQEVASRQFDRQWVQPAKKKANLKDDEELLAVLRKQGTSLEAVGRQWQRDFMAREYRRSCVMGTPGPSSISPEVNPPARNGGELLRS